MTEGRVLIVDDDPALCRSLATTLRESGFDTHALESAGAAFEDLRNGDYDVVLTDLNMREMTGLDLCRRITAERPDVPVLVITAFGSMQTAIESIRAGAYDFITRPVDLDAVAVALRRAIQHRRLREEVRRLRTAVASQTSPSLLGKSAPMARVNELITRFAASPATVLITGESGTGKEVAARLLHDRSDRADGPFVAVSCAAIPEALIESELFGHVRGAFTDARQDRRGLLVQATGGTLLLDEIGEMPLATQAKLLRALQERRIRPLGSAEEVEIDARIVAATHRDLEEAVDEGRFRADLFFRIHVLRLPLPPLRARGTDVLLLAQDFLRRSAERAGVRVAGIGAAAAQVLLAYDWPGNVRELQNAIEHAVAVTRYEHIVPEDLPEALRAGRTWPPLAAAMHAEPVSLDEVERRYVLHVLQHTGGNKRLAARILDVDRKTLYRKLERWGVAAEDEGT